ncbi:Npt1/Npt2 family nucleotide transporter [Desulfosarcina sp.]|uniref:Npt1/Npt2 family nucleotide transporter n=1 Tax=Desulfosarcina sp. TaxID=2027861 RepID=UPI003563A117
MSVLNTLLRNSMDIRKGEGPRVALMFSYIFLIITALMIVKPVANAQFLSTFGAGRLPFAFIAVAVLAVAVSSLYTHWLRRIDFFRLIIRTLQAAIAAMVVFWGALYSDPLRLPAIFILYVWAAVIGLIVVSQFWILANAIFNPREARRLFSVVGAGAIAGGIFGGYLTNLLAAWVGSANLILVGAGCLAVCILLAKHLYRTTIDDQHLHRIRQKEQAAVEPRHPLVAIARSRHLSFLAGIIGLSVIVAKLVEYQFSAVATAQIPEADQLTAFFGFWLSNLNVLSLLIQLFVTRRVVGMIGVGVSLFFLPMVIALGSVLVLIHPALWAAIFLKVGDGSLKNSVNKAALELMVLPVPADIKSQAKTFIDVIVDSTATGLGGLLLLGLTAVFGLSVRPAAVLTIILIGIWVVLIQRIRKAYIDAFRSSLTAPMEAGSAVRMPLANTSIIGNIVEVLDGDNVPQIIHTLRMTRSIDQKQLVPSLRRLIRHPSATVRLEALKSCYPCHDPELVAAATELIADPNAGAGQAVMTEAMHYLFRHADGDRVSMLGDFMRNPDAAVSGAALVCASRESRRNPRLRQALKVRAEIDSLLRHIPLETDAGRAVRFKRTCAAAIGAANIASFFPYLNVFLSDTAPEVVKAAVKAAGETRHDAFVPAILEKIRSASLRQVCSDALKQFGPDIDRLLANCLSNPLINYDIRRHLPDILAAVGSQTTVTVLVENLDQKDPSVRNASIRALNRLRRQGKDLRFDDQAVVRCILQEARRHLNMLAALYYQIDARQTVAPSAADTAVLSLRQKLAGEIEKRLDVNLERIFSLLGLKYPVGDISRAYQGLVSGQPDLRANAIEFLDNVLDTDLKRSLIPIVETALMDRMIEQTIARLGVKIPSEMDAFALMLPEADADLQIQALDLIAQLGDPAYAGLVAELMAMAHPRVRAAAGGLLQRFGYLA